MRVSEAHCYRLISSFCFKKHRFLAALTFCMDLVCAALGSNSSKKLKNKESMALAITQHNLISIKSSRHY